VRLTNSPLSRVKCYEIWEPKSTEQLQRYIPWKHGWFQVHNLKTLHKGDNRDDNDDNDDYDDNNNSNINKDTNNYTKGKQLLRLVYKSPTTALFCNKTLIQMSHTKTLKITPTYFDHQMIIIRELFDVG
jgi:hypothetical protein